MTGTLVSESRVLSRLQLKPGGEAFGHVLGVVLTLAVLAWGLLSADYMTFLLTVAMAFTAAVAGLNILFGMTGSASMGQGALFGAGAYGTGWLLVNTALPLPVIFIVVLLGAALLGTLLVVPTLRVSGLFLAMVTLAYALLFEVVVLNWDSVTGGPLGLSVYPRDRDVPATAVLFTQSVLVAAVCIWVTWRFRNSALGRGWRALGHSEASASVLGVPVVRYKVIAFVTSSVMAAAGGYFYAAAVGYLSPTEYDPMLSVDLLVALIVGGAGRILGPAFGSLLIVLAPEYFDVIGAYEPLIVGLLLLVFLTLARGGIAQFLHSVYTFVVRRLATVRRKGA